MLQPYTDTDDSRPRSALPNIKCATTLNRVRPRSSVSLESLPLMPPPNSDPPPIPSVWPETTVDVIQYKGQECDDAPNINTQVQDNLLEEVYRLQAALDNAKSQHAADLSASEELQLELLQSQDIIHAQQSEIRHLKGEVVAAANNLGHQVTTTLQHNHNYVSKIECLQKKTQTQDRTIALQKQEIEFLEELQYQVEGDLREAKANLAAKDQQLKAAKLRYDHHESLLAVKDEATLSNLDLTISLKRKNEELERQLAYALQGIGSPERRASNGSGRESLRRGIVLRDRLLSIGSRDTSMTVNSIATPGLANDAFEWAVEDAEDSETVEVPEAQKTLDKELNAVMESMETSQDLVVPNVQVCAPGNGLLSIKSIGVQTDDSCDFQDPGETLHEILERHRIDLEEVHKRYQTNQEELYRSIKDLESAYRVLASFSCAERTRNLSQIVTPDLNESSRLLETSSIIQKDIDRSCQAITCIHHSQTKSPPLITNDSDSTILPPTISPIAVKHEGKSQITGMVSLDTSSSRFLRPHSPVLVPARGESLLGELATPSVLDLTLRLHGNPCNTEVKHLANDHTPEPPRRNFYSKLSHLQIPKTDRTASRGSEHVSYSSSCCADISELQAVSQETPPVLSEAEILSRNIARTLIGTEMFKYFRQSRSIWSPSKHEEGNQMQRHKRYVLLRPHEGVICWSSSKPAGKVLGFRKCYISEVHDVADDSPVQDGSKIHNRSLLIVSQGQSLRFSAMDQETHLMWFSVIKHLLEQRQVSLNTAVSCASLDLATEQKSQEKQNRVRPPSSLSHLTARPKAITRHRPSMPELSPQILASHDHLHQKPRMPTSLKNMLFNASSIAGSTDSYERCSETYESQQLVTSNLGHQNTITASNGKQDDNNAATMLSSSKTVCDNAIASDSNEAHSEALVLSAFVEE